jgi:hypothetical protein
VNTTVVLVVATPHVAAPAEDAVDDDVPFTTISTSSSSIELNEKPAGNVRRIVCPISIPLGIVNAKVWFEAALEVEFDRVSLAFVIDAASATWKSVGRPVLQRSNDIPSDIATACKVLTVVAV